VHRRNTFYVLQYVQIISSWSMDVDLYLYVLFEKEQRKVTTNRTTLFYAYPFEGGRYYDSRILSV
jgi:hypothetical protein